MNMSKLFGSLRWGRWFDREPKVTPSSACEFGPEDPNTVGATGDVCRLHGGANDGTSNCAGVQLEDAKVRRALSLQETAAEMSNLADQIYNRYGRDGSDDFPDQPHPLREYYRPERQNRPHLTEDDRRLLSVGFEAYDWYNADAEGHRRAQLDRARQVQYAADQMTAASQALLASVAWSSVSDEVLDDNAVSIGCVVNALPSLPVTEHQMRRIRRWLAKGAKIAAFAVDDGTIVYVPIDAGSTFNDLRVGSKQFSYDENSRSMYALYRIATKEDEFTIIEEVGR